MAKNATNISAFSGRCVRCGTEIRGSLRLPPAITASMIPPPTFVVAHGCTLPVVEVTMHYQGPVGLEKRAR